MKLPCSAVVLPAFVFILCLAASIPESTFGAERGSSYPQLKSSPLAGFSEGRELLEYIVNCALPGDQTVVLDHAGEEHHFAGGMGLAPDWLYRALTETEQERVSACILARTNAFGVTVQISLRAMEDAKGMPASLDASAEEERVFGAFEGTFFGNIFTDPPAAYVCRGTAAPALLRQRRRVCALPEAGDVFADTPLSLCGFRIVEACSSAGGIAVDGHAYTQGIRVFVKSEPLPN